MYKQNSNYSRKTYDISIYCTALHYEEHESIMGFDNVVDREQHEKKFHKTDGAKRLMRVNIKLNIGTLLK